MSGLSMPPHFEQSTIRNDVVSPTTASASGRDRDAADRLRALDKPGVGRFEQVGERGARHRVAAVQADHLRVGAVQVDHRAAAGLGVQQVDVLGDHAGHHACVLQFGQRAVTGVGQRAIHVPPADVIARPVPLPKRLVGGELADGHRVARRRVRPAVIGDARVRGHPRAGEHRNTPPVQHGDEFRCFHASQARRSGSAGGLMLLLVHVLFLHVGVLVLVLVLVVVVVIVVVVVLVDEDGLDRPRRASRSGGLRRAAPRP